jgi:hypothetical protein
MSLTEDDVSPFVLNWCKYEWFYSHVDSGFFEFNEFREIMKDIGFMECEEFPLEDLKSVKLALGRPRRFSPAFIGDERRKLNKTREAVKLQ